MLLTGINAIETTETQSFAVLWFHLPTLYIYLGLWNQWTVKVKVEFQDYPFSYACSWCITLHIFIVIWTVWFANHKYIQQCVNGALRKRICFMHFWNCVQCAVSMTNIWKYFYCSLRTHTNQPICPLCWHLYGNMLIIGHHIHSCGCFSSLLLFLLWSRILSSLIERSLLSRHHRGRESFVL